MRQQHQFEGALHLHCSLYPSQVKREFVQIQLHRRTCTAEEDTQPSFSLPYSSCSALMHRSPTAGPGQTGDATVQGHSRPQVVFRIPWATFPLSILSFSMLPSHKPCLVPVSSSISQPGLCVWYHGGGELGQDMERGSPGATGGVEMICVASLHPESSGGRGQDCAIPAVSVFICPLRHNLLYSKVDTYSRAEDLHPRSSCSSPLTSAFSQPHLTLSSKQTRSA